MSFIYKDRPEEFYQRRATQRGGISRDSIFKDGVRVFTPRIDEQNRIRILPPTWDNPEHFGYDVWVHYGIGANNSAFLCLKLMKGEHCPICEQLTTKQALEDPVYAKKLKAKRKVVVYIIDRKEEEVGPKVWAMPWQLDKTLVIQARDEDTGAILRIDRPDDGYDVYFDTVKGATKDIAYTYEGEKIARKSSPISTDPKLMDKILEYIVEHPIPSVLEYKPAKYIQAVFSGSLIGEDNVDIPIETKDDVVNEVVDVEESGLDRLAKLREKYKK